MVSFTLQEEDVSSILDGLQKRLLDVYLSIYEFEHSYVYMYVFICTDINVHFLFLKMYVYLFCKQEFV